ncbi:MAG TPA: hypothetical protein VFN87_12605 [Solirubrobacteraceae bacterium]|nr:hypothetical protein [Solirubrobacteraceae bacterium]
MSASSETGTPRRRGSPGQMYRVLREQALQQQRRRQQKIERLVRQHGQRALKEFRHPSR